jgi:hypothetical protein
VNWQSIQPATKDVHTTWNIPDDYLPTRYYDVYNMVFRLENALRMVVFAVLKTTRGSNWDDVVVRKAKGTTLADLHKNRLRDASLYGNIGMPTRIPMVYFTFGDLLTIVECEGAFKSLFSADPERVIVPKLREVEQVRNNLAHFREVTTRDCERLLHVFPDAVRDIDRFLASLTDMPDESRLDDVPSDFDESRIRCERRRDGKWTWVELAVKFQVPEPNAAENNAEVRFWGLNHHAVWDALEEQQRGSVVYFRSDHGYRSREAAADTSGLGSSWMLFRVPSAGDADKVKEFVSRLLVISGQLQDDIVRIQTPEIWRPRFFEQYTCRLREENGAWSVKTDSPSPAGKLSDVAEDWSDIVCFEGIQEAGEFPWFRDEVSTIRWELLRRENTVREMVKAVARIPRPDIRWW